MRTPIFSVALSVLLLPLCIRAEDAPRTLSLVQAQAVCAGDVEATGRVLPQFSAMIGSRLAAHITDWGQDGDGSLLDVGMRVAAGQPLFTVDPGTFQATVDSAQAALASAEAALANLVAPTRPEQLTVLRAVVTELEARAQDRQHDAERYRRLVEDDKTMPPKRLEEVRVEVTALRSQLGAAQARLDEATQGPTKTQIAVAEARVKEARAALATAQLDLRDAVVRAPFPAVITRRLKGLGDYVAGAPFVEVLELVTVDRLEAELRLPEAYLPQVVAGQTQVLVASPQLKEELELTVTRVVPQIDSSNGTFVFRVAIPAATAGRFVPGAFVTARCRFAAAATAAVLVPFRALISEAGKSPYVLRAEGGKMVRHTVEVGSRLTEGAVIRNGIKAGDLLVAGPPAELQDGAPLPEYLRTEKKN